MSSELLFAKDLSMDSENISPNLVTIPDDFIPHQLNDKGSALLHKIHQDVSLGNFKDTLNSVYIFDSHKLLAINKYAYGIRESDGHTIKTGPILFSHAVENGWIYTLNGSLYKITTLSI